MAVMPVDDIDIFYRESGSGQPLILIMGFTANADWWPESFVTKLARQYRVITIDNRGAGRTPLGKKRFTILQAASDTVAFMDALGIERAHVFGISMGGMIAQQMAISFPNRVDHLILGCTMARPITGFLSGLPGQAALLARYLWDRETRARPWVVNVMFSRAYLSAHPEITSQFKEMASQARIKPRAWLQQLLAILRFHGSSQLPKINHPTLVIVGTKDLLIAPIQSKRLARRLPNVRYLPLPGLGHALVGEAPIDIANHLVAFFCHRENP